jgi:ABC-type multidrug transport system ATPase subunit
MAHRTGARCSCPRHLISEFEGLIDEFTIIDRGRAVLTMAADEARERYQKIQVRFANDPGPLDLPGARTLRRQGRTLEVAVNGNGTRVYDELRARAPEALAIEALTLEEIFVSTLQPQPGLA